MKITQKMQIAPFTSRLIALLTLLILTSNSCKREWDNPYDPNGNNLGIAPVAAFKADKTAIIENEAVLFTDQSTNSPTSWDWTFGDEGSSTLQNPTHTYNTKGSYTVTLIATNSSRSDTVTKTNYISVSAPNSGSISDADGNIYTTVTIGTQVWLRENLKTTKYRDGTDIPLITDNATWEGLTTPGYGWYDNNIANKTIYGALYNWYVVDSKNLCPTGYHVPSQNEWNELIDYLGGLGIAGGKMKESGTTHWAAPNDSATNSSGFTALPGGRCPINSYESLNIFRSGSWWSSTEFDETLAWGYTLFNKYFSLAYISSAAISDYGDGKYQGFSVRCIKDAGTNGTAPVAAFKSDKTTITEGSSVLFTDQSTNSPTSWAWNFGDGGSSTQQNPTHSYTTKGSYTVSLKASNSFGNDTETKTNFITVGLRPVAAFKADKIAITEESSVFFTDQSTNKPTGWAWNFGDGGTSTIKSPKHIYLTQGIYTVTLKATNSFGNDIETKTNYITVSALIYDSVDDIDGNTYKTLQIGNQTWMAENLKTTKYNDGTDIDNIIDNTAWSTQSAGAYCWYNNEVSNKTTYGALYNFYSVNTGKLAPTGWHVPNDAEWTQLIDFLGGEAVAGGKLKEAGYTHWASPNTGADNSVGFKALPAGYRVDNGAFGSVGFYGLWWSSSAIDAINAWGCPLYYNSANAYGSNDPKSYGLSVRCIRD